MVRSASSRGASVLSTDPAPSMTATSLSRRSAGELLRGRDAGLVAPARDEQHGHRDLTQRLGAVEALERVEHGEHPWPRHPGVDELALGHESHREPLHPQGTLRRAHERAAQHEAPDELGPLHGEPQRHAGAHRDAEEVGLAYAVQLELVGDAACRCGEVEADGVLAA